jgi:hypothetical protein
VSTDNGKVELRTTIRVRRFACDPCPEQLEHGDCEHFLNETEETQVEEITLEEASLLGVHRP